MRARIHPSLLLLLAAAALSGCSSKNPTSSPGPSGMTGSSSMQTQIVTEMTQMPGVIEDGISNSQLDLSSGTGGALAAITPFGYWRTFDRATPTFSFAYSDTDSTGLPTRAVVTITTHLTGLLHIRAGAAPPDTTPSSPGLGIGVGLGSEHDSTLHIVTKPLGEMRLRIVDLRRARLPHDMDRESDDDHDSTRVRWRLAGFSGVKVTSDSNTTQIESVRIQEGSLDTTITDPLTFVRLRRLIPFHGGAPVMLTVTTSHSNDVVSLDYNDRRIMLKSNGDGTYSGQFRCRGWMRGLWHFGVDAVAHATLYDDATGYDSQRWVFPYVIAPERFDGPEL